MSDLSGRTPSGWEREWAAVQQAADAPRDARLGCSIVTHDHLAFCAYCHPLGSVVGASWECMGWRLLALQTTTAPARTPSSRDRLSAPDPTP